MVERLDVGLVEEPEDPFLQLPAPLARNDLHQLGPAGYRFGHDVMQGTFDVGPSIEYVM
jgi:hypothetical protein